MGCEVGAAAPLLSSSSCLSPAETPLEVSETLSGCSVRSDFTLNGGRDGLKKRLKGLRGGEEEEEEGWKAEEWKMDDRRRKSQKGIKKGIFRLFQVLM